MKDIYEHIEITKFYLGDKKITRQEALQLSKNPVKFTESEVLYLLSDTREETAMG